MHLSAAVGDVGDEGSVPSLWSQLPKIVVVGGQVRCLRSRLAAGASRWLCAQRTCIFCSLCNPAHEQFLCLLFWFEYLC